MTARLFINSFTPLAASKAGRQAALTYDLPPFIDGSIRREPDLEHEWPAISCLCRGGKFAPRLQPKDVVAYFTKKGRYGTGASQRRLIAILLVHKTFPSHAAAADWYQSENLSLPSNCMVHGNESKPLDHSHRLFKSSTCIGDARTHRTWNAGYRRRSRQYPIMVVCETLFSDLSWNAPVVDDDVLIAVFGRVPGTQNPASFPVAKVKPLAKQLGISIPLFDP